MRVVRAIGVMGLILFVTAALSEAGGEAKKKKKGGIKGSIVSVSAGKEANEGTITVKQAAAKKAKGAPAPAAKEIKIMLTKDTKIEKAVGKKKDKMPAVAGAFGDLQAGKAVVIVLKPGSTDQADRITVSDAKKKKTK